MLKGKSDSRDMLEEKAAREWKTNASIRAEFGEFERYRAYVLARESGQVKAYQRKPNNGK